MQGNHNLEKYLPLKLIQHKLKESFEHRQEVGIHFHISVLLCSSSLVIFGMQVEAYFDLFGQELQYHR
jgi:hypothetical protein